MKTVIRHGCFETNSSSTHSIVVSKGSIKPLSLPLDEHGRVCIEFGEYGCGPDTLSTQREKMCFLLTMAYETECRHKGNVGSKDAFAQTDGFKALDEFARENIDGCIGLNIGNSFCDGSCGCDVGSAHGYIDHNSCEYESLADFLNQNNTSIRRFVRHSGTVMEMDYDG